MTNSTQLARDYKEALDYFVELPVSTEMVDYLAKKSLEVIRCDSLPQSGSNFPLTPPDTPPSPTKPLLLPSVVDFITTLVERSRVSVPTLMSTLVYLDRLKAKLPVTASGMRCTAHRIFLVSLILAAKNLNDSSPKNKHWARYTTNNSFPSFSFSIAEINLMEKQMLYLLDWNLRIWPEDLYRHLQWFLEPIRDFQAKQRTTYMNMHAATVLCNL
jgi:G1/S-specific cyclin PLC1